MRIVEKSAAQDMFPLLLTQWQEKEFNDDQRLALAKASLDLAGASFLHEAMRLDIMIKGAWLGYTHLHALIIDGKFHGLMGEQTWEQISARHVREQAPRDWRKVNSQYRPLADEYKNDKPSINDLIANNAGSVQGRKLTDAWEVCSRIAEAFRLQHETLGATGTACIIRRL